MKTKQEVLSKLKTKDTQQPLRAGMIFYCGHGGYMIQRYIINKIMPSGMIYCNNITKDYAKHNCRFSITGSSALYDVFECQLAAVRNITLIALDWVKLTEIEYITYLESVRSTHN